MAPRDDDSVPVKQRMSEPERHAFYSGHWHDRDTRGGQQLTLEVDFEAPVPAPRGARSPRHEAKQARTKRARGAS